MVDGETNENKSEQEEYSEEDIRLMRIKFLSEMGN